MKNYIIVADVTHISLQNEVNRKIKEGYHPFGDLLVMFNSNMDTPNFYQPMIKYEENEKEINT